MFLNSRIFLLRLGLIALDGHAAQYIANLFVLHATTRPALAARLIEDAEASQGVDIRGHEIFGI